MYYSQNFLRCEAVSVSYCVCPSLSLLVANAYHFVIKMNDNLLTWNFMKYKTFFLLLLLLQYFLLNMVSLAGDLTFEFDWIDGHLNGTTMDTLVGY